MTSSAPYLPGPSADDPQIRAGNKFSIFFYGNEPGPSGFYGVWIGGELDRAAAPLLCELIDVAIERNITGRVLIDAQDISFCDVGAIRALIEARDKARDNSRELVLMNTSRCVKEILELAGWQDAFTMIDGRPSSHL